MDAEISVEALIGEFEAHLDTGDFEGAEELLAVAIGARPALEAFFHFQFGRLYSKWNKLTSAVNHLNKAAELAKNRGDDLFVIQVVSELKAVKQKQLGQRP